VHDGPVHDHGDTWAANGVYRGAVRMIRWQRVDDGSRPERAEILLSAKCIASVNNLAVKS